MAAPSFVKAGTGATDAGGAWSYTCHTPTAAGAFFIVQVLQDGTSASNAITVTSITNAENLAGTDNVLTALNSGNGLQLGASAAGYQYLFLGRSLSTSVPVITGGNSGTDDIYVRSYEFANVAAGTTLATVIEEEGAGGFSTNNGTGATASDAIVVTSGVDRLALNFVAVNDDNAISDFTGETGGDWTLAVAPYAEASGTDGAIGLQAAFVSALCYTPWTLASTNFVPVSGGSAGSGETNQQQAESFTTVGAITAVAVMLKARKNASPADDLVVEIQTDNAGAPSGTVVGSGGSCPASSLATSAQWVSVALNATLSAATTYWIVVRRSGARDATNNYSLTADGAAGGPGTCVNRDNNIWSGDNGQDILFALQTATSGTIDGGTENHVDSDAWGVVGFALIGTTPSSIPHDLPLPQPSNFQNPAIF